jgi:hypothetical protein
VLIRVNITELKNDIRFLSDNRFAAIPIKESLDWLPVMRLKVYPYKVKALINPMESAKIKDTNLKGKELLTLGIIIDKQAPMTDNDEMILIGL